MRITVFGGSQPRPGDLVYTDALRLGELLGAAGLTVLTGGYMGVMEAVSQGAARAGGHVIGVTCDEIERWRPNRANAWVQEEWRRATLRERLFTLIEACDAAVSLPGGPGTLAEVALAWNLLIIGAIPVRPLIVIGAGWQAVFETFYRTLGDHCPVHQRRWLTFAPDVEVAVGQLLAKL
jgi:hypothetical protein